MNSFSPPAVLTIASSDSSGGAGIQADLKTFAALEVYGLSVICTVTAQNTQAVTGLESLSPALISQQLEAVWADLPPAAVKIGLLGPAANARAIGSFLAAKAQGVPIIIDPVMVSTSGHVFLTPAETEGLKSLFPLAALITPNWAETEALTGIKLTDPDSAARAAEKLLSLGPQNVLIKGGHQPDGFCSDRLFGQKNQVFDGPKIRSRNTHGTGCTFSSAIAAFLARGCDLIQAAGLAKDYVTEAIRKAPDLGRGAGPLHHFHQFYAWNGPGKLP
ncbi:MAG: bifunctional hydroxymethylpyrimidine kinase/phosphomethylpyrimidine kinase [Deltaproteobacteria bacterium]|jgi:hydroxymethylpyrimidine/phosphomethylpyrimidine kinase|nr:bifunctional hydroxymethylpyrimidine kinase/phosphomethylpyrimidine kinase [Deltaproteobacteria bacterium]